MSEWLHQLHMCVCTHHYILLKARVYVIVFLLYRLSTPEVLKLHQICVYNTYTSLSLHLYFMLVLFFIF